MFVVLLFVGKAFLTGQAMKVAVSQVRFVELFCLSQLVFNLDKWVTFIFLNFSVWFEVDRHLKIILGLEIKLGLCRCLIDSPKEAIF